MDATIITCLGQLGDVNDGDLFFEAYPVCMMLK